MIESARLVPECVIDGLDDAANGEFIQKDELLSDNN